MKQFSSDSAQQISHSKLQSAYLQAKPVLPQDLLFKQKVHPPDTEVVTPAEYASELKTHLHEVYQNVAHNLGLNREQMQKQYNKNIRFHDYHVGEKVWLKTKYYKTGENKKLSPRRNGPWTIVEKLPNGLNFQIENDSTGNKKIVHHNRTVIQGWKKYPKFRFKI